MGALALSTFPEQAVAESPVIDVSEPEGFSSLTEEQTLLVDVYFGNVRRGETTIVAAPGSVRLVEPQSAIALLPALTDRGAVATALSGGLAAHAELACTRTSDLEHCGRYVPDIAGVIFDREHFRLDIFVNPWFLAVNESPTEVYLPEPQRSFAVINSVGAVISGRLGNGPDYYNFQNRLVVGSGARRLRADMFYASEFSLGVNHLALEWDHPDMRYSAGALWAPGSQITGQRKLLGVGVETQIDTRLDRDKILGSPVVVFLERRARVDILRDGRVLSSAIYEAGNQQIDTANLPDGSYSIDLRIEEPGRPPRIDHRFYTKSRRIPSLGRTDFLAFSGVLVDDLRRGSLDPSGHPYFQGRVVHRIDADWALGGGIEATDEGAAGELAAIWLTRVAQLRVSAVADSAKTYGGIVQISSAGSSHFNYSFDLRRIEESEGGGSFTVRSGTDAPAGESDPRVSYSQASGIFSYSLPNLRFLGTLFYRDDADSTGARYSVGPSIEWDFLRVGHLTFTLRSDVIVTERGSAGFAGISLRLLGDRSTLSALAGSRFSGIRDDTFGDGPVAAISGAWSPTAADAEIALGAGYDHRPGQDDMVLSSDFRHRLGSLSGDLVHTDGPGPGVTQYSLGMQTTLVAGADALMVAGQTTSESIVVARIGGARESDSFEVLVNEQKVGKIVGDAPLSLPLPAYRAYTVRIRPTGEELLTYDSSPRKISLYPGTVAKLEWNVAPVTIKFGRLIGPDGSPVGGASITGKEVWGETDDEGNFQIEAPDGIELTVRTRNGDTFAITLPQSRALDGIAKLGALVCCDTRNVRLGALQERSVGEGGPK